jgi:hypothetical protein
VQGGGGYCKRGRQNGENVKGKGRRRNWKEKKRVKYMQNRYIYIYI